MGAGEPRRIDHAHAGQRRETVLTVAIEPDTARPYRARQEKITEMNGDRQVQIRDTAFDWSKAVGCTVP